MELFRNSLQNLCKGGHDMRFGVCTGLDNLGALAEAGYDYIEITVAGDLKPEKPEDEVLPALEGRLRESPLRAETYNVLLPGDLKIVGPDLNAARQERYLEAAFSRARALGGQVVVFGSGVARGIPEGYAVEDAYRQLREFVTRAGDAAARHGLTVAIEPLNRGECNVINSVGEAMGLARAVSHPAVGVLSDLYHIAAEGQTYTETRDAGPLLKHVHVAGQEGRRAPIHADLEFLTGYFRAVKESGYDVRVSVEGSWQNLPVQAAETLDTLQRAWEAA